MVDESQKRSFVEGFLAAEKALKKYEREGAETLVPCINELRYAASHVAMAIKAELEGGSAGECWQKAVRHTHRARFDVLEFNVALCVDKVAKIADSYKGYEFLAGSIVPHYFKHKKALIALSSELEGLNELDKESPEFISICEKHIRVARDFMRDFYSAEEVLFSEIERREKEKENSSREKAQDKKLTWLQLFISCILSAVLGVVLTMICV